MRRYRFKRLKEARYFFAQVPSAKINLFYRQIVVNGAETNAEKLAAQRLGLERV